MNQSPARGSAGLRVGAIGASEVFVQPSSLVYALIIAALVAPNVESVAPGLGVFTYVVGLALAVLFYLTLLLHEASHAVVAARFGRRVPSITVHFFGAMTAVDGESRSAREEFTIAVVGPVTSLVVGGVGVVLLTLQPTGLLQVTLVGLTVANLGVGLLNLVPGLPLDGGRVLAAAVWWLTGSRHRGTLAAGWAGRVVAVLVLLWPVFLYSRGRPVGLLETGLAVVVALFLWSGASSALRATTWRSRLPDLHARSLARRTLAVPEGLPLAEALRRASEADAGAILTETGDGRPVGVVVDSAVAATPEDRRPWVPVSSTARTLEPGSTLAADLRGEDLVRALGGHPTEVYLLVELDGSMAGVLRTDDVDRAFRAATASRPRRGRLRR